MNNSELIEQSLLKAGVHTEKEIWGQPDLWQKVYKKVQNEKDSLLSFLKNATSNEILNIILTGAGSSAFIGLSLIGTYKRNLKKQTTAISTTDLVTHPKDFIYSMILSPIYPLAMLPRSIITSLCNNSTEFSAIRIFL